MTGVGVTRERLVRAATSAVMRRGVHGSGLGDICERAGVTKGVFTHHFPHGKQQLVSEVVDRTRTELTSVLHGSRHQSAPERVRGLFTTYADRLRRNDTELGCPVAAAVVDVSAQWPQVRDATRAAFAEWSEELGGGVGELVVAALEGAILQARAQGDASVVDRIGDTLADLLATTGVSEVAS